MSQTLKPSDNLERRMPREHGKDGEFVETVTLEDVLETFEHVRGPVILSGDVADRLGCSRETARRKLEELYERGDVDRRKAARRVIYWRAEETAPASPDDEPAAGTDADAEAETPTTESAEPTDGVTDRTAPRADDLLAEWDPGRDREEREDRRAIGRQVLEWFRETEGYVSAADVKATLYPDLAYADESADTWWRKLGRPPLKAAVDAGLAEYREGYHDYRWLGEASDRGHDADEEDGGSSSAEVYDPTEEL